MRVATTNRRKERRSGITRIIPTSTILRSSSRTSHQHQRVLYSVCRNAVARVRAVGIFRCSALKHATASSVKRTSEPTGQRMRRKAARILMSVCWLVSHCTLASSFRKLTYFHDSSECETTYALHDQDLKMKAEIDGTRMNTRMRISGVRSRTTRRMASLTRRRSDVACQCFKRIPMPTSISRAMMRMGRVAKIISLTLKSVHPGGRKTAVQSMAIASLSLSNAF
mmetsp:Transcript_24636/g.73134  ORF Transcript_24636/g.73134 Transcript_24636/m.73134 type:complete len:225 (-) Transcript_24636:909-1583(-)